MKLSWYSKASIIPVAAALVLSVTVAQAQVTKDDAKCRATANKGTTKLSSTANKAVIGCVKDRLKGKNALTSCTNPFTADTKGKLPGAVAKLEDSVGGAKSKCDNTTHAAALALFSTCPSPGTQGAITGFGQVGTCLGEVVTRGDGEGMIRNIWSYTLNADVSSPLLAGKDEAKCVNGLAKSIGKHHDTVTKTLGKLQQGSDKSGGAYAVSVDRTDDSKGKIGKSAAKLADAITKSCTGPATNPDFMLALGSCSADVTELASCIDASVRKNASSINAISFEMAGVCPTQANIISRGSAGFAGPTRLDAGSTGLGHRGELPDGIEGAIQLDCSADDNCSSCTLSVGCSEGNCRCANDPTISCDEPFGPDADDCSNNTCQVFFGPPLPLNAGGTFTCVVNEIPNDIVGSADTGTGAGSSTIENSSDVYTTGTQSQPCPSCDGDPTPNDGVRGGTCNGGQQDGATCDANAVSSVFGDTSYDCQPLSGQAIATISLSLEASPDDKSLGFDLPCTTGDPAGCPCAVCSNDPTLACDEDADCSGGGLCNSAGPGVPTVSNACDDLVCNAGGVCNAGTVSFCDGYTKESGGGIISCSVDGDCTALNTECPGGDCGTCTLVETRACFNDPIVNNNGLRGQDGAIVTAQFCIPPTGTGVDAGAGVPGAGNLTLDIDFVGECPNGTEYELGGHNCQ